jgi:hypothetical protein
MRNFAKIMANVDWLMNVLNVNIHEKNCTPNGSLQTAVMQCFERNFVVIVMKGRIG